jgi:nicotinamidase-related amidase
MPIPRLTIDDAVLLVIDVQERLIPTIVDRDRLIGNCINIIRMAELLGVPYLITEQYPAGLGRTVQPISAVMTDQSRRVEKTRFSALVDLVNDSLEIWQRRSVLVCGIEAHVCVLQTVLDLQATGRQSFVLTDAVSAAQRDQIPHALQRMARAGAVMTGVISAMYELLGDSTHASFRQCLELAKLVQQ